MTNMVSVTINRTLGQTQPSFTRVIIMVCSTVSLNIAFKVEQGSSGTALKIDPLRMFQPKFGSNSPSSFKREDKNVYIQGQATDTK
jgi:hypothetical protein